MVNSNIRQWPRLLPLRRRRRHYYCKWIHLRKLLCLTCWASVSQSTCVCVCVRAECWVFIVFCFSVSVYSFVRMLKLRLCSPFIPLLCMLWSIFRSFHFRTTNSVPYRRRFVLCNRSRLNENKYSHSFSAISFSHSRTLGRTMKRVSMHI